MNKNFYKNFFDCEMPRWNKSHLGPDYSICDFSYIHSIKFITDFRLTPSGRLSSPKLVQGILGLTIPLEGNQIAKKALLKVMFELKLAFFPLFALLLQLLYKAVP